VTADHHGTVAWRAATFAYPDAPPALGPVDLDVEPGSVTLVVGESGSGKSVTNLSILRLLPERSGGRFAGDVRAGGRSITTHRPRDLADVVGFVHQTPEAQFVVDHVEHDIAFAMENLGLAPRVMRRRVEEVLDQLGIAHRRSRRVSTLSGGEKQRVALAAVMTLHPQVLVLDEPTSQLDPQAAEEVLIALRQLNEDLGLTVILSEHRLERVVQYADRILYFPGAGEPILDGTPDEVLSQAPLTPPLVTLGKALGWRPLPLTIKEARRFARQLDLTGVTAASQVKPAAAVIKTTPSVQIENAWYDYAGREALRGVSLTFRPGELVALMGRNGAGKTTLMKLLVGLLRAKQGRVRLASANGLAARATNGHGLGASQRPTELLVDASKLSLDEIVKTVGYVPQDPGLLLFQDTLAQELTFTRSGHALPADRAADQALLAGLGLAHLSEQYPRDLSGGERQRAALAAILVADPQVLLLDEPTRGLDYQHKSELVKLLRDYRQAGKTIIMATHDVELVAACADRVIMLAEGQVVLDAPTRIAMSESLVFASQINKLLRDPAFLTVDDVLAGLRRWQQPHAV